MKMSIWNLVETHACLFRKKISRELQDHIINYEGGIGEFVFNITPWGPKTESLAGKLP